MSTERELRGPTLSEIVSTIDSCAVCGAVYVAHLRSDRPHNFTPSSEIAAKRILALLTTARQADAERIAGLERIFASALRCDIEEVQAVIDALLFTEEHAGLVSDAHGRAKEKIVRRAALSPERQEELELAWGIIANAGGGDWTKESAEWQDAAHRWGVRNGYRLETPHAS